MDQVSNRSGVGSDDITDESASLADVMWNSDNEEVIKIQDFIKINRKILLTF